MSQADKNPADVELIPGNDVILLSPEAFDSFERQLNEAPSVADNEKLQELLKRPTRWA